ncbi:hypothetical protein Dimus_024190 [Dionaea muscipula]
MKEQIPINLANVHIAQEYAKDDPYYPFLGVDCYSDPTPIISTPMHSTTEGFTPPSSTPIASIDPASSYTLGFTPPISSAPTGTTRRTLLPTSSPLGPNISGQCRS